MRWTFRRQKESKWELWFAWHPVRVTEIFLDHPFCGEWVWLEWVNRKRELDRVTRYGILE